MSRDKQNEKNSLVLGWEFAYQNDRPCIVITEQIGNEIYILCSSFESAGKIELQGYRKSTDLAEEIFAEIEEIRLKQIKKSEFFRNGSTEEMERKFYEGAEWGLRQLSHWLAELKKKYTEEGK